MEGKDLAPPRTGVAESAAGEVEGIDPVRDAVAERAVTRPVVPEGTSCAYMPPLPELAFTLPPWDPRCQGCGQ